MAGGNIWKRRKQELAILLFLMIFLCGGWRFRACAEAESVEGDVAPSFSLLAVNNDKNYTVTDTEGNYYFQDYLCVQFSITEEEPAEGEVETPIVIRRNGSVILEMEEGEKISDFTDTVRETGQYVYTMKDTTITVHAVQAFSEPDMELSCKNGTASKDDMYYLNHEPELTVNISDEIGIAEIAYRTEGDGYQVLRDYGFENIYAAGENLSYEGAAENLSDTFDEIMQDMNEGTYRYIFRVTNVLGNVAEREVNFLIDKTDPDPEVFISYETDGTNKESVSDTGIIDFFYSAIDKLFGKSQIRFHLYVRDGRAYGQASDGISGIDIEDILSQIVPAEGNASVRDLKIVDENATFVCDGKKFEGYVHIQGIFALPSEDIREVSDKILITRMKDRAGNIVEKINAEDISGAVILYLDQKAPVLQVDYKNGRIDHIGRQDYIFYPGDAEVKLGLNETFYYMQADREGNPVSPKITVTKNGSESSYVLTEGWMTSSDGGYSNISFPASDMEDETEYEFTVEYQDPSGNHLSLEDGCPGNISEGVYVGCPIIVDNRAPELTAFSIEGETDRQINGVNVYRNRKDNDVRIAFTINDHALYWNPEAVKLSIYSKTTKEEVLKVDGTALDWIDNGREHKGWISFDGNEDLDFDSFYAVLSYKDRAGNFLAGEKVKEGIYTSVSFILDHKDPVFHITYSEAYRLVKEDDPNPSNDLLGMEPEEGYTAYYGKNVEVEFSVEESSAIPVYQGTKLTGLMDFHLSVKGRNGKLYAPQINWSEQGVIYKGTFALTDEDTYTLTAEYKDAAGNGLEGGNYKSMNLVLDRTAPVIRVSYTDTAFHEITEEDIYFSQPIYLKLTVEDQNIRYQELKDKLYGMKLYDRKGNFMEESDAKYFLDQITGSRIEHEGFTWYIPLTTEANYDLFLECEDLSGNQAEGLSETFCVDYTNPEMELSYEVQNSGFLDAVRYGDIRYLFANEKLKVNASARDSISGIQYIRYTITDKEGKEEEKTASFEPADEASYSIMIPLEKKDFRGIVCTEVSDWSGNKWERMDSHIIESLEKHKNAGSAVIKTYTAPSRTAGGEDYYNTDVHLNLTLEDEYSGLRKISYSIGNKLSGSKDYAKEADDMVFRYSEDMILNASDNNENDIRAWAELVDNAGHTVIAEQFYHIDITAPVITVEYDQTEPVNGQFYDRPRTATVTIRERNFDERDVDFRITNSEGIMPVIGNFHNSGTGDGTLHVCQVVFEEDGDYTFTVAFEDKAGNRAEYGQADEFTIDRTAPVLTVAYDNNQKENEIYYAEKRTASIDILEHNFDPALIKIMLTKDGEEFPFISEWSKDGEHNRAYISFDDDAIYTVSIRGSDRAGNVMEEYGEDSFVIDKTPPILEIFGVKDQSANQGTVMPGVRWEDVNGDPDGVNISIRGSSRGVQKISGEWRGTERGMELQMEDFPYNPEEDDRYTLEAVARDLAGNQSEACVNFSVNRFGSVYTFDERTASLAGEQGTYYTNQEQDIVVTETNVDSLEFHEITCNRNGELRTLKEGEDYTAQISQTEKGWKQYTYKVGKENFREEGTYVLTIYSEDRAKNRSDNQTKGKELAFAIDKTFPEILIAGLKDGGQYRENNREITVDVQDNVCVKEVSVILNGEKNVYSAADLSEQGGKLTVRIGDSSYWQTVQILAVDMAGNEQQSEEIRFLLTSNILVQLLRSPVLMFITAGILGVSAAGAGYLKAHRNKKQEVKP